MYLTVMLFPLHVKSSGAKSKIKNQDASGHTLQKWVKGRIETGYDLIIL